MKININQNRYGTDCDLFDVDQIEINSGITTLVGRNGSGKTTMLREIMDYLGKNNKPVLHFDGVSINNTRDEISDAAYRGNLDFVFEAMSSSEGQNIVHNFSLFAEKVGNFVQSSSGDVFIVMDAVDSGLSIDNVVQIRDLFEVIVNDSLNNVYIIASTNSYELTIGADCIDVKSGKHIKFEDYNDYRNFILEDD